MNQPSSESDTDSSSPEQGRIAEDPRLKANAPPQKPSRRLGLPSWTLGLLILALTAVLVWAGNAFLRSRQQFPAQEPPPTATARPSDTPTPQRTERPTASTASMPKSAEPDATLILVASPIQELYETLSARMEDLDSSQGETRVERMDAPVQDADAARSTGQATNAGYVLWGRNTDRGTEIYLTRINPQAGTRATQRGHNLALSVPPQLRLPPADDSSARVDLAVDTALAIRAYDQPDLDRAEQLWDEIFDAAQQLEDDTLVTDIHLYQGNMYALNGDDAAAISAYGAAIETVPTYTLAYVNRGAVRFAQGDYEAALADLNQALELAPDIANAYYNRANVYRALEQPDQARADLDRALELDPQHARAYASRGLIRHNAGEHEAALEDYTRAIELSPEAADVYLNRGGTYATLGMFEAAIEDYTRALELAPDDADAYYNRGTVYAMLEQYDRALADLDRALALKPDFGQIYGNRGLVYKALGKTEKAIADLERFLELSDNPEWRQIIEGQLAELQSE